jgi:membrane protein DedA with SNARE-associated domain
VPAFILPWIAHYGIVAIFVLLLLGVFGLPIPDETLLTFAGVLVRQGQLHLIPTILAAALGSMCGITISYTLGRALGLEVVDRYGRWFHVSRADLQHIEQWLERWGKWTLTVGYFVPGVRHLTAIVAGSSRLPRRTFALFAYSGALIWATTFITLGWYVGERWEAVLASAHRHLLALGIVLAVIVGAYAVAHRLWLRRMKR